MANRNPIQTPKCTDMTGVTLLELIIVICVLAVLAAIAAPSMSQVMATQRLNSAVHLLHTQLSVARNTAITQRTPIRLCPSKDGSTCTQDGNWNNRWLMYRDRHASRHPRRRDDILMVSEAPSLPSTVTITSSTGRRHARFQADGRSGGSNLTISFCLNGSLRSELKLNNLGRARAIRIKRRATCR